MGEKLIGGLSFSPDRSLRRKNVVMSGSSGGGGDGGGGGGDGGGGSSCQSDCSTNCDCGTGGTCDSSNYINVQKGPQGRRRAR